MAANNEVTYEVVERIGVIRKNEESGWTKEVNLVSWNEGKPKFDIRDWSADHQHMSRGITLFPEEMQILVDLYRDFQKK